MNNQISYNCKSDQDRKRHSKSSFWMHDPKLVFDELKLSSEQCFLDLGCGPGDYTLSASQLVGRSGRAYALDINQDAIDTLREKAAAQGLENIKAVICDITRSLPIEDESIDVCLISTVLHTLDLSDVGKDLFCEIRRVLKPNGRMAIIECKKEGQPCGPPISMRLSPEELKGLIARYGFEMTSLADLGHNYLISFRKTIKEVSDSCEQMTEDIIIRPVGIVKNVIESPFLVASADGLKMRGDMDRAINHVHEVHEAISSIIIDDGLKGILDGIEEYSHITILYWAHKVPEGSRSLKKVHPMGRDDVPEKGIFSTCSPARPNPVLTTVVRLVGRKGNVLEVTGLDAIDGSPVIDIKPYVKELCPQDEVRIPEWMQRLQGEVGRRKL